MLTSFLKCLEPVLHILTHQIWTDGSDPLHFLRFWLSPSCRLYNVLAVLINHETQPSGCGNGRRTGTKLGY